MSEKKEAPLTRRQQRRVDNRAYVSAWASRHGETLIGNGSNPHNQARIFAVALQSAGVTVYEVREESANTTSVHHQEIDRNGILTGHDVRTHWAKKRPPNGRLADLRDWIELLTRIGVAGTVDRLPDIQCTPYAAAILCKHLGDPRREIEQVIQERYLKNPSKPFKKAYHLFDIGDDLVLGIKVKEGILKIEYAFQPGRTAWLKASDVNLRMSLSEVVRQGLQGSPLGRIIDTGDCPYLKVLGETPIDVVHDNGVVASLRLRQDYVSLWKELDKYVA